MYFVVQYAATPDTSTNADNVNDQAVLSGSSVHPRPPRYFCVTPAIGHIFSAFASRNARLTWGHAERYLPSRYVTVDS